MKVSGLILACGPMNEGTKEKSESHALGVWIESVCCLFLPKNMI